MNESTSGSNRCRNCGSDLTDAYCGHCGQRDLDFRRDWRGLVSEVSSTFLNLDGKVPQGLFALLFRPGLLTRRFLEGARVGQIPPLRLYLFVSLCFFLLIGQSSDDEGVLELEQPSVDEVIPGETEPEGAFEEWLVSKLDDPQAIQQRFVLWLPRFFLFGVPLLALYLRVIFWRQRFVYLEYLVMALHFQTFMFLLILLAGGVTALLGLLVPMAVPIAGFGAFGWLVVYPVLAVRRIFGFSWVGAVVRTMLLEIGYLVFLGLLMAAVGFAALTFA